MEKDMGNFPGSTKYEAIHWDIMIESKLMDLVEKRLHIFWSILWQNRHSD